MRMTRKIGWLVALVVLVLAGIAPAAIAAPEGEPEKKSNSGKTKAAGDNPYAQAAKGKKPAKKVYGNDDLQQLAGGTPLPELEEEEQTEGASKDKTAPTAETDPAAETAESAGQDALEEFLDRKKKAAERREAIAAAEQKVTEALQKVAEVERRLIAIRNPYLARPEAPEGAAEEWKEMDAAQRVERSKEDLKKAQEEVKKAEEELQRLRSSAP